MSDWIPTGYTLPRARKHYDCFVCARTILPGTRHVCRSGIVTGVGRVSLRLHRQCDDYTSDWDQGDWETFSEGDRQHVAADVPLDTDETE